MRKFPYMEVGDGGYGYKIIQHDNTKKQTLLTPKGKLLTKAVFDDIIGFYHHFGYEKNPTAIGIIGNRVYNIDMNGNTTMLRMSKDDFLNMKRTDEARRNLKKLIRECVIKSLYDNKLYYKNYLTKYN